VVDRREKEENECAKLRRQVERAKRKHQQFLSIGNIWNRKQKQTFSGGVSKYEGAEARTLYCELVGLSEQWIHGASEKQLRIAAGNLELDSSYAPGRRYLLKTPGDVKDRLLLFLKYS